MRGGIADRSIVFMLLMLGIVDMRCPSSAFESPLVMAGIMPAAACDKNPAIAAGAMVEPIERTIDKVARAELASLCLVCSSIM